MSVSEVQESRIYAERPPLHLSKVPRLKKKRPRKNILEGPRCRQEVFSYDAKHQVSSSYERIARDEGEVLPPLTRYGVLVALADVIEGSLLRLRSDYSGTSPPR
ncbi:hypothetical protein HAX54_017402 [Datura stramonium]|uniref:Uncharacterized protein n=1 Tax=Datura stramonium TaxID=4076 RepID=A0ABS8UMM7_DATST|nr:hypothetical protein [Datura stramonium]